MALLIPENAGSRKDLGEPLRRVARALQVALDDDALVWFEPLFDPSGERPHFVVLEPRIGVAVVEVLRGRPGGRFLGLLRGSLHLEVEGEEEQHENPLHRAETFAGVLRKSFALDPLLAEIPVASVPAFTGISRDEAADKGLADALDVDKALFAEDLEAAIRDANGAAVIRCLRRAMEPSALAEPLSPQVVDRVRAVIHPDTQISAAASAGGEFSFENRSLFRDDDLGEDAVKVMDRRQEAVAKTLGSGHRVIRGVAGSGKTLILVHRARLLAELFPAAKVLVTCYTRSLAAELNAQLPPSAYPNVEVVNLDKLMAKAMRQAKVRHPGYNDGSVPVANAALEAIRKSRGLRYEAVLVDEAQDFDTEALQFCVELLDEDDPDDQDLIIVADSAQNIFRKNFRWKDAGIRAQGRTRILRVNYRNTREILEFAHAFLMADPSLSLDDIPDADDEAAIVPPESAERSGPQPELSLAANPEAEVAEVVRLVGELYRPSLPARSIAVLYGGRTDGEPSRGPMVAKALSDTGLDTFWVTDPKAKDNRDHAGDTDAAIVVSTIQSAKGLEFPAVVLCGLSGRDDSTTTRKLLYVGMTRSTVQLHVVTTSDNQFADDLRQAQSGDA